MSSTDIAALLNDQKTLSEGKAKLIRMKKESVYHAKQAERKAAESVVLEKNLADLQAKLDKLTGVEPTPPPAADAVKPTTEKPKK